MSEVNMTLPTDSTDRKNYALFSGCLRYFPAALAGVGKTSKLGNDKHNPGEELHHARGKSVDHGDCIMRHLIDTEDLLAAMDRGEPVTKEVILAEVSSMAWRALAFSQELHEKFGAPLAPGAREGKKEEVLSLREYDNLAGYNFMPNPNMSTIIWPPNDVNGSGGSLTIPEGANGGGIDTGGTFVTFPDGRKVYTKATEVAKVTW